jgi:hypothetical protein
MLITLIASVYWQSIQATTVLPVDLTHLHTYANSIIYAECIDNKVEVDNNMNNTIVTFTTFNVLDTIKGPVRQTLTIKQIGGKMPDNSMALKIPGVPEFRLNKKYILFLPKASYLGFTSPIALSQGSFQAIADSNGNLMVGNGRDFAELMININTKKMPAAAQSIINSITARKSKASRTKTTMPLNDFITVLKNM